MAMSEKWLSHGLVKEDWADNWNSTKLFFTMGNWEIHGNPLRHTTLNPAVSRVVHYCEGDPRVEGKPNRDMCHVWATLSGSRSCPSCQELMPESIQTLWTLQNFDVDFSGSNIIPGSVTTGRIA
jgi:hypothetical protein